LIAYLRYRFAVTVDLLTRNWSLAIAAVLATVILLFVAFRAFADSARGQLLRRARSLRSRYAQARRARKAVAKAAARLQKLQGRAASVKPRHVQEAAETLEDARSLLKIAEDQVMIAENHVRKVIVEEFPPKQHAALRSKYLASPEGQGKPFTF